MYITNFLSHFEWKNIRNTSKEEILLLEVEYLVTLCDELNSFFKLVDQNDLEKLIKLKEKDDMVDTNLAKCLINDILMTQEYTLQGIAYYTQTHLDVIYDIALGLNTDPSYGLFSKIIKLHQTVRPELYREVMQKFIFKYLKLDKDSA